METRKMVYLPVGLLQPHPDNPRKDLGDLQELSDSIRAKGVLQNMTVVPHTETDEAGNTVECYRVIIGHRRLAASKMAGLAEVPCVITEMSAREQFETMMIENVQRSDLSVYEQAEGFQMMLDLGDTVEDVARKTGFSASTIRNRAKLLTLDKKKFQKAQERGGTMQDYLRLNAIEDPAKRNKVLDQIGTPEFNGALKRALDEQEYMRYFKRIRQEIEDADWLRARTDEKVGYGGDYQSWKSFDRYNRNELKKPEDAGEVDYIYMAYDDRIYTYRKGKAKQPQVSPEEKKRQSLGRKLEKIEKELKQISDIHRRVREDFVRQFSAVNSSEWDIAAMACRALTMGHGSADWDVISRILNIPVVKDKNSYNKCPKDPKRWESALFNEPLVVLLAAAYSRMEYNKPCYHTTKWDGKLYLSIPSHEPNATLDMLYSCLGSIGYELCEEELQMKNGTHPLFEKAKKLVAEYKKGQKK